MSAFEIVYSRPAKAFFKSYNIEKVDEKHAKSAKERLLFCKCTC